MKLALLHLKLFQADLEANRAQIRNGLAIAVDQGAEWILSPEYAQTGYYFTYKLGTDWIVPIEQDSFVNEMLEFTKARKGLSLFLWTPERDSGTNQLYNSQIPALFILYTTFVLRPGFQVLLYWKKARSWEYTGKSWSSLKAGLLRVRCLLNQSNVLNCGLVCLCAQMHTIPSTPSNSKPEERKLFSLGLPGAMMSTLLMANGRKTQN
mmetsp:Transcript_8546/g.13478  ORF Transcript_8546/g.13478 Transcript_8546/m.13478 type:complete len:208 (+) Transcript_8546:165-788(+)